MKKINLYNISDIFSLNSDVKKLRFVRNKVKIRKGKSHKYDRNYHLDFFYAVIQ